MNGWCSLILFSDPLRWRCVSQKSNGPRFLGVSITRTEKKTTTPSGRVCEGCRTIMCEKSGFKYDTYICLMALPPSEPLKGLVQLRESHARVSLLKSALFLQKFTCLSLELTRKMHSLAVMLQRKKKGNTWSRFVQSLHLDFVFTFTIWPLGEPELSKTPPASKDVCHSLSLLDIQPVVTEAAFQIWLWENSTVELL